jgi:hypothetical protein
MLPSRSALRRIVMAASLLAVWGLVAAVQAQRTPATAMAGAASRFLASLTPPQRQAATFPFDAAERLRWNFIPTEMFPRNGLLLKDMTPEQRTLAHALLQTGLSQRGYATYTAIIQLEDVLRLIDSERFVRDPVLYRVSVFGTPGAQGAWGWRVEGHHVSLHFTIVNGVAVASTPSFAGTNPAEVKSGPQQGTRILAVQEDAGRALATALDASQRATAIVATVAPGEILTENKLEISPLAPAGIKASALTAPQRERLMAIVEAYAGLMAPEIAAERMNRLRTAGLDNLTFAWAGPLERGQKHYYRVQGPTMLIEFDNTQNAGNHVHSIWRDFNGDFGRDLLREHLRAAHGAARPLSGAE